MLAVKLAQLAILELAGVDMFAVKQESSVAPVRRPCQAPGKSLPIGSLLFLVGTNANWPERVCTDGKSHFCFVARIMGRQIFSQPSVSHSNVSRDAVFSRLCPATIAVGACRANRNAGTTGRWPTCAEPACPSSTDGEANSHCTGDIAPDRASFMVWSRPSRKTDGQRHPV